MKQRMIDWFYKDMSKEFSEAIRTMPELDKAMHEIAEKKGTELYKHLYEQPYFDVEKYYEKD